MINYCEKESILVSELRKKSAIGITNKYNWDYIAKQYFEVFQDLIQQRN